MEFRTSDINQLIKIVRSDGDIEPISVIEYFRRVVEKHPNHDALAYKGSHGLWLKISYEEYHRQVEKMAKILIKMGLKQRGVVAILAWNSPQWVIMALAAIHAGGVITALYTTSSTAACQYILENSQTQLVMVDDDTQMDKISSIKLKLPNLISVIEASKWSELMLTAISDDVEAEYQRRLSQITPNQCCSVIYTSGTSGFPKGVMLSHDNLIWNAIESIRSMENVYPDREVFMSYLPLSHLAAFMGDIFIAFYVSGTVYFTDPSALKGNLLQYLQEIQPTIFIAVPRVYEKVEEKIRSNLEQLNFFKRKLLSWAQNIILEEHLMRLKGEEKQSPSLKLTIAKRFVSEPVKALLGLKRCKIFVTGSAPIDEKTKKFFMGLDMLLREVYGMTESSTSHTVQPIQVPNLKTVGKNLATAQTKIANANAEGEGEICMKGRHVFMGYLNDVQKTNETIDDEGWLHSGDVGSIDDDGFIYVSGRIKDILITSGGENIPTTLIENLVKSECNAISNAFLIGDKRKFLTMLLTLKTEINGDGSPRDDLAPETLKWLKNCGIVGHTRLSQLLNDARVKSALQDVINRVNSKAISNPQKIQKFALLPQDFSLATGELTNTMKIRRHVVLEMYKEIIDQFYS